MTDLDDKLREIYPPCENCGWATKMGKRTIAQIKQAFKDAGWKSDEKVKLMVNTAGYMTGQSWYERYCAETSQIYLEDSNDVDTYVYMCDEAAKKAAGIE